MDAELKHAGGSCPSIHICTSYLWTKLAGANCYPKDFTQDKMDQLVGRWLTKNKVGYDVFQCRMWVIPINILHTKHWVYVTVDFRTWSIVYVDSMLDSLEGNYESANITMLHITSFVAAAARVHQHVNIPKRWHRSVKKDTPQQVGGNDCGVYVTISIASLVVPDKYGGLLPSTHATPDVYKCKLRVCRRLLAWELFKASKQVVGH